MSIPETITTSAAANLRPAHTGWFDRRALGDLMRQVGADMPAERFLAVVTRTYQEVKQQGYAGDVETAFRRSPSHGVFGDALVAARKILPPRPAILVLGCGPELAGCDATYAAAVVESVFPVAARGSLACHDVRPPTEDREAWAPPIAGGPFDLLVSHSLVHFAADVPGLLAGIAGQVAPRGVYVMAHEPNARYWRNAACQRARSDWLAALRRRKTLAKYFSPGRYLSRLTQWWLPRRPDLTVAVNRELRQRHGFTADLRPGELSRLVDPHRPGGLGDAWKIGLDGFDGDALRSECLPAFQQRWLATYDHLGYRGDRPLPRSWQQVERALRTNYPSDGAVLSAVWQKEDRHVRN